jgi:ADP-heptose:LPS heptosyltransferase
LKEKFPDCKIYFLGKTYTQPIIQAYQSIDEFIDWEVLQKKLKSEQIDIFKHYSFDSIVHIFPQKKIAELAYNAKIPQRIGTNRRLFHWLYCNNLVSLKRKNSQLHEAELNAKLLAPFGIINIDKDKINHAFQFHLSVQVPKAFSQLFDKNKFRLILHPKSKGSAREWPLSSFLKLIHMLPEDQFQIFISGNSEEAKILEKDFFPFCPTHVINTAGMFNLSEFISFIQSCHGLVAASTGPLHIASALGIHALGLYPPIKSMSTTRWGPIGKLAQTITATSSHSDSAGFCQKSCEAFSLCLCMKELDENVVYQLIRDWQKPILTSH